MEKKYLMGGKISNLWKDNEAQQLTFVVTQDCNLMCKYCYMLGKNKSKKMSFEIAKKAVDFFLDNNLIDTKYVILDFIGGEPLLEIELIDKIVDYYKLKTYLTDSRLFGKYRISIGTNGVLYNTDEVQRFIRKNSKMVSIGMTIDGIKEKHDMQRVFPNGEGSYDIVEKNMKLLLKQYPNTITKVTISHDDLPYLKDSIVHLWKMGLHEIPANVVFENAWTYGDDKLFENQLIELADYIIDNKLWNDYNVTLFSDNVGFKEIDKVMMTPVCGTGKMFAVDSSGDIYSCVRFMDYSLSNKKGIRYGNVNDSIDEDKIRPFKTLYTKYLSEDKCINCNISSECLYCAGCNYNETSKDTLFDRFTAVCQMHKARVRANRYYWARLHNEENIDRSSNYKNELFMFFVLSEDSISYCSYNSGKTKSCLPADLILEGLRYARDNFLSPVFIHSQSSQEYLSKIIKENIDLKKELKGHIVRHIIPYGCESNYNKSDIIYVANKNNILSECQNMGDTSILVLEENEIKYLYEYVAKLYERFDRVNLNIVFSKKELDLIEYDKQLKAVINIICSYKDRGVIKEFNRLTDRIYSKNMNNCFSGEKNITLGIDGDLYVCPAFYYAKLKPIGNLKGDLNKDLLEQTKLDKAPLCSNCDAYQCNRCIFLNYKWTGEFNTPSKIQCVSSHIERKNSKILLEKLLLYKKIDNSIPEIDYMDPMEKLNFNANRTCRL